MGGLVEDAVAGSLARTYRQARPSDLARVPVPAWRLARGKNYLFSNTVVAGRGCPWQCEFCYSSSANVAPGHRMKPVANVLAEIASLGRQHVFFIDDNFIGTPARARELMRAMAPLGITWHAAVSADVGRHDDLLDLMAETGCQSLFIGFETINQVNLAAQAKRQNRVEEYDRTIAEIHNRGIMVNASIVFGFDHDGPRVFADTVRWLTRNKVETMTAHILTPYPGTKFYDRLMAEGRITDFDRNHYNTSRVVFRPKGMTVRELEGGYLWSYREFYSLAGILKRLPAARSQWVPYLLFNLGYRRLGPAVAALGRLGLMGPLARLAKAVSYSEARARQGYVRLEPGPQSLHG